MGEKYLGQLTAKSAPATGDILVLEDSEDTKKIDYDALANAILNKLTTKTYTVAGGTNTLIAAIDALNSNLTTKSITAESLSEFQTILDTEYTNNTFMVFYLSNINAENVGLSRASHMCIHIASGINERIIIAFRLNGAETRIIYKSGGSWASTWRLYTANS